MGTQSQVKCHAVQANVGPAISVKYIATYRCRNPWTQGVLDKHTNSVYMNDIQRASRGVAAEAYPWANR